MATNYFLNQYFTTTLNVGGGIDASQTTGIIVQAVSGLDITKPGVACITYADPINTSTAEWVTYTSIDGSNELQGVTRGTEGFGAKTHSNGAVIAFPISESHINTLATALSIGGVATNGVTTTLDEDDMASNSATALATQQSIKAYVDTQDTLYTNTNIGMARQAIINGNFDVWQRGTSVALADATTTFLADRWKEYPDKNSGTLPTLTRSRQILTSGDISNAFYYTRLATNGAGTSLGNSSTHNYFQTIENGVRNLCGLNKTVTVSFWARSDIANKKLGLYLFQNYGSGGSPTSNETINGTKWTLTSTWTEYTHTFTTNTLVGKTFGTANDDSIYLLFKYMWGSSNATVVGDTVAETYVGSGNIDIAQVQLCAGSVALPFQPKSYEDELRACQRYYQLVGKGAVGRYVGSSSINVGYQFLVEPRAISGVTPTLTTTSPVIFRTNIGNDTGSSSAITTSGGGWVQINGLSGGATNEICIMTQNYIVWNAEL